MIISIEMKSTQVLRFSCQQSSSMQVNNCGLKASITGTRRGYEFLVADSADTRPVVSVAISSFITAGFLFTALASGALSVSSATLAAAGACSNQASASFSAAYPSRNFLVREVLLYSEKHFLYCKSTEKKNPCLKKCYHMFSHSICLSFQVMKIFLKFEIIFLLLNNKGAEQSLVNFCVSLRVWQAISRFLLSHISWQ
jgi:hypothetical protein